MGRSELRGTESSSVPAMLAHWSAQMAMTGVPSPMHDARFLAAHVLDVRPGELFLLSGFESHDLMRIDELVRRRATREPLQYITGSVGFMGLDLIVGPGVFVPRPETELMADHVVKYLKAESEDHLMSGQGHLLPPDRGDKLLAGREDGSLAGREDGSLAGRGKDSRTGGNEHLMATHRKPPVAPEVISGHESAGSRHVEATGLTSPASDTGAPVQIVDLCTGSGALGLALAGNVANVACVGVETSPVAADYAKRNSAQCGDELASQGSAFVLLQADAISVADVELAHLQGAVDVVVCNPPYVPDGALPREPEVRDHDPAEALYGGPDGLDVVRRLVDTAAKLLRAGGLLAIEHADSQGEGDGTAGVPGILRHHRLFVGDSGRSNLVYERVVDHLDLNGRPRFTTAVRRDSRPR